MAQKLSDTLVKAIDRSNPMMQNLQLASRFNELVEQGGGGGGANLENNRKITITENGTVEITPAGGKDGMKKVTATVNVPSSSNYTLETLSLDKNSDPVTISYADKVFVFLGRIETWGELVGIGGMASKLFYEKTVTIEDAGATAGTVSINPEAKTITYTPNTSYNIGSISITKLII